MTIKNQRSKKVISKDIFEAKNLKEKTLGLILNKTNQGIIVNTRFGIHTFFMKRSIDILVLDNDNKVVGIKKNLKPFRLFVWNPMFDKVLELQQGAIKKSETKLGDKLMITE